MQRTKPCKVCIGQMCIVGFVTACEVLDYWWPDGEVPEPPRGTAGTIFLSIMSMEIVGSFAWGCWTEPFACRAGIEPGEGHMFWTVAMSTAEDFQNLYRRLLCCLHPSVQTRRETLESEVSYDRGLGRDYGLGLDEVD